MKLGEVCDSISATFDKTKQQVVPVNTSDVLNGKVTNHVLVNNKGLKGQFKKTFQKDDILYSEIRPKNKRFAFIDFNANDYVASTKLMVIRANEKVLPQYLYQVLKSEEIINQLQFLAESRSGTFPQITFSELAQINVRIPKLDEQKEIADFLRLFDDKIENNKKINHHLEQMAQAIFKSWFIDFEPFGGVMPLDWRKGTFSEMISSTLGGDWGKESPTGNYQQIVYCMRGADIPEITFGNKGKMPIRYILPKNFTNKRLMPNDIVIEISGGSPTQSTGRCALMTQSLMERYEYDMVCTNFCRAIKPKEGYSEFIYYYWQYLYEHNVMFLYENGTTGIKNFDISSFLQVERITIPSLKLIHQFSNIVKELKNSIAKNGLETEKLINLRGTLLPKLLSGEISVNHAAK